MCSIHQPERKGRPLEEIKSPTTEYAALSLDNTWAKLASMETLRSYETAISLLRREKGCDDAK